MNITAIIRPLGLSMTAIVLSLLTLVSCDDAIYDDEGDCSVAYKVRFRYDMNLKWADAFASEVKSVHLYAFDKDGVLAWHNAEKGNALAAEGYTMTLDVPAGDYTLIAWCGLENEGEHGESFSVPEMTVGRSHKEELMCSLNRKQDTDGKLYSNERLYFLYHGIKDVTLPENLDGGEYVYTLQLTKDTNHVRVILAHLSGKDVDVSKFTFRIEDENGLMGHDNALADEQTIEYREWKKQNGEAGIDREDPDVRGVVNAQTAIADLTVGRMTEPHRKRMMLTITNDEGKRVAKVPVIDYVLLAKDYYEEAYGHKMTDQEFLDREDEHELTFFLDEHGEWISSSILIHSWRVVLNHVDID